MPEMTLRVQIDDDEVTNCIFELDGDGSVVNVYREDGQKSSFTKECLDEFEELYHGLIQDHMENWYREVKEYERSPRRENI